MAFVWQLWSDPRVVFGIVLLVVQGLLAIPLIWKLWRSSERAGISLTGEMIWIAVGLGWSVYGVNANSPAVFASSLLAIITSTSLTLLMWRFAPAQQRTAVMLTAVTVIMLGLAWTIGQLGALSLALSAFGVVQFVPQLLESAGYLRRGQRARGVSVFGSLTRSVYTLGWAIWAGAAFLWGPTTQIDWPVVTWGIAGAVTFALQTLTALRGTVHTPTAAVKVRHIDPL